MDSRELLEAQYLNRQPRPYERHISCPRDCDCFNDVGPTCDECGEDLTTEIDGDGFIMVTHECKEEE